jgi:hypothetical protein
VVVPVGFFARLRLALLWGDLTKLYPQVHLYQTVHCPPEHDYLSQSTQPLRLLQVSMKAFTLELHGHQLDAIS